MNTRIVLAGAALLLAGLPSCESLFNKGKGNMGITSEVWGSHDGKRVELFTIENKNGIEAKITNYGGIIVSLEVPDKKGTFAENQKAADDVRNGEMKAIGFLVGQVMKLSQGKANPGMATELIKKQLGL